MSRLSKPTGMLRFFRFACIGGAGFVVDAGVLTFLVNGLEWGVYEARAVSFGAAVTCTWYANRRWVFARIRRPLDEYGAYFLVQAFGGGLNLCIYVTLIQLVPALSACPVVPLAAGAAVALLFNYFAAARIVFADLSEMRR